MQFTISTKTDFIFSLTSDTKVEFISGSIEGNSSCISSEEKPTRVRKVVSSLVSFSLIEDFN